MSRAPATTAGVVPHSITVRLDPEEEELYGYLLRVLRAKGPRELVMRCMINAAAQIQLGQQLHSILPSDLERERPRSPERTGEEVG